MITALPSRLFDLVCPGYCLVCGGSDQRRLICQDCTTRLTSLCYQACPRCAAPQPPYGLPCSFCRAGCYEFEKANALGLYHGLLRDTVLAAKRPGLGPLAYGIGQLVAEVFAEQLALESYCLITAAPVHWRRRLRRGFNGAELMMRGMQSRLEIPARHGLIVHQRPTLKQSTLSAERRHGNVKGAFGIRPGHDLAGQRVLLLDDVMTTGATANELSRVLLRAGATRVDLLVVARGLPAAHRRQS